MADDKLSFLAMAFADNYGQEFFFQDEYDDSLALAMAAVGDNIITFKYMYVIFIFLTVKTKFRAAILYVETHTKRLFLELSGNFFRWLCWRQQCQRGETGQLILGFCWLRWAHRWETGCPPGLNISSHAHFFGMAFWPIK